MKLVTFFMLVLVAFVSTASFAQSQTDTIKVYGNCGMCKNRIEKAVKLDGVTKADWNPETKLLIISYDPGKISNESIQKAIVAVGHDTDKYSAEDAVYQKLPGCCLYERKKTNQETKQ